MGFHKGTFTIQNYPEAEHLTDVVVGWIDENQVYGFYKRGKNWVATDLVSGTSVTIQPTRKACVEWIEENADKIAEVRETQAYKLKVESFRDAINSELKRLKS